MISTPREYPELKTYWLAGNVAFLEVEIETTSLILDSNQVELNMNGVPTGYAFVIEAGHEAADWVKALKRGTRVKLHDVDLRTSIDISNTNVPHIIPNSAFPGFSLIDPTDRDFEEKYKTHPTILLRNPDYHIIAVQNANS